MLTILQAMLDELSAGRPVIVANVAVSSGATPRSEGAYMAVGEKGLLAGTIGGGSVEYRAIQKAQALLVSGLSDTHNYVLNKHDIEDLGMICGGDVVVRFLYLPASDGALLEALDAGIKALRARQAVYLLSGQQDGDAVFLLKIGDLLAGKSGGANRDALLTELDVPHSRRVMLSGGIMAEALLRRGRVVIFGGGHVGMALAHALVPLDFHVVVLDDREAFVTPDRFPDSVETALIDLTDVAASFAVQPDDYVCIMTRGHRFDQIVQAQMLRTDAHYIGVIGSRHKAKTVFANLKAEYGFSDADLARITTPIGIALPAETPEEIAVSIAAQLIDVRAKHERNT